MAKVTGDLKATLKDLQADMISLKHETQSCIMDASMRKAFLTQSEQDVRDDIRQIQVKLEKMLKQVEIRATSLLYGVVKGERDSINAEILSLEEIHKGMEETEEYIKSKTSNISLKPLQEGREKCDVTKDSLTKYKDKAEKRGAQFVLHPLLALILEQIENFVMGDVILRSKMDEVMEQLDNVPNLQAEPTNASLDPSKTSFMRSNSSKLIRLNSKETKQDKSSRQNSANSASGKENNTGKNLSRQNSENAKAKSGRRKSLDSKSQDADNNRLKSSISSETQTVSTKDILKRTLTEVEKNKKSEGKKSKNIQETDDYRSIFGLKATLTKRSATAPLINLTSPVMSTFATISEEPPIPVIHYKETLETLKRDNNCYITGVAMMANGSIVVCDNVHDSVQLYNAEYQQISELECRHPWAVTTVSDGAVAVTLHYDHKVVLIKAVENLERLNEKDIVLKCQSALCFDVKFYEFRLYVLCMNSDVHVVDLKGREYNVIRTGFVPNTLKYLDVDVSNQAVFISGENGIACLDFRGLPLWHYKVHSKGKMLPTGILFLKGRIIFCDWANHCLKELYEDGAKVRTVYTESIENPVAITASENGDMIIFSQGDYDMDVGRSRLVKVLAVGAANNP